VQEEHGLLALLEADEESYSTAKEVTIDWWKLWLTLEDQMPNEPVIQHRILMWMDVWKVEYCSDMAWWIAGGVKPLSMPRWTNLRKEALTELACEWYGTLPGTTGTPLVELRLKVRPAKSNFGSCIKCRQMKDKWLQFRTCPESRKMLPSDASKFKSEIMQAHAPPALTHTRARAHT
jgi:hypothetical protein